MNLEQVKVFPVVRRYLIQTEQTSLVAKIEERRDLGIEKYGQELHTFNGRDARKDAEEEILDCLQYVTQLGLEKDVDVSHILSKLVEVYQDLG